MKRLIAAAAIAAAAVALWTLRPPARTVRVECVDVGAGQCWIVRGPGGSRVVINCGRLAEGPDSAAAAVNALVRSGTNSIDCLVATRAEPDACSGVKALAKEFRVKTAAAPADALEVLRKSVPELDWQPVRPGGAIATVDGLMLSLAGSGQSVEAILVEMPPTSIALIDRLSPETVRQLAAEAPAALVLGFQASRSGPSALGALHANAAVLHSGRGRGQRVDYGLVKTLQDRCERVWQTWRNGGITLQANGRVIRAVVTHGDQQ